MTLGRFLIDRIAARFGPIAVLRWGSVLAAAALSSGRLVAIDPRRPWSAGRCSEPASSGTIPQLFSAAGRTDPAAAAANISRVAGLGYLGMLAGPAVIGALTHVTQLNYAFVLPLAFCVISAVTAPMLGASRTAQATATRAQASAQQTV